MTHPDPTGAPAPDAIRWIGHATASIHVNGLHVLTDPLLRDRLGPLHRRRGRVTSRTVEAVDVVLISHMHHDHLDLPSLRRLGRETPLIVPVGAGRLLQSRGFRHVEELPWRHSMRVGGVTVTATPAAHPGWRRPFGPAAQASGYLVEGEQRVYFAGDTELFDEMSDLRGAVDVSLLPVGGWGPTRGEGHLDPTDAAEALTRITPSMAVPIHWGTFWPVGLGWLRRELFDGGGPRFAREAALRAPEVDIHVLEPGASIPLPAPQRAERAQEAHAATLGVRRVSATRPSPPPARGTRRG